jgi:pimeloyl-ACP methyl ester carboxylesterase
MPSEQSHNAAQAIETWRAGGRFFDWHGHDIHYRDQGGADRPALVMIHGFPTASWDWRHILPAFQDSHRVIMMDLIGFGLSAKPRRFPYSIHAQADMVDALLADLGVTRCRILAHDYGDTVTQELLARQGERQDRGAQGLTVERAVLLNGGLFPETHLPVRMQKLLISPLGPLVVKFFTFEKMEAAFRHICARPLPDGEVAGYWALLQHNNGRAVMPLLIRYMEERRRHRERWVGTLQQAAGRGVPLWLIDGTEDPISGGHMVARYRELIPDPDVVELAGVGHYPQTEAPDAVIDAARPFFAEP